MKILSFPSVVIAILALAVFAIGGCNNQDDNGAGGSGSDSKHVHDGDAHDHDHDHDDEEEHASHGPFHGHVFSIDSPDYQAEWVKYPGNNVIRMYVLDSDEKEGVAVKVDSFTVTPMVGNDDMQFELAPEDANEKGETFVYMLDDQELSMAIPLGVKIEFKIGDKVYSGVIKAHEPLDH